MAKQDSVVPPSEPCSKDVLAAVSNLGLGGKAISVDAQFRGAQCRVYKVDFIYDADHQNQISIAVRVPIYMNGAPGIICLLQTEWEMLQILQRKGFSWSPVPLGCSFTFDNPIKHPFLVLAWGEGSTARWTDDVPPRPLRDRFLSQMAGIQVCLLECTLKIESQTWQQTFERIIRNKRTRIRDGVLPELSIQDCDDQEALLPHVLTVDPRQCDMREYAMDHGDFQPQNIIVDKDYNITCVIDWAFAGIVPLPRAAGPPRMFWGSLASEIAQQDRRTYLASFEANTSRAALRMRLFQTGKHVECRTRYVESLYSKGAHAIMAKDDWKISGCDSLNVILSME